MNRFNDISFCMGVGPACHRCKRELPDPIDAPRQCPKKTNS